MSDLDFKRVRVVFLAARRLDQAERAGLLQRECGADEALRCEVESLLSHHDRERARATAAVAGGAIEKLRDDAANGPLPRPFGAFELIEVIGVGGMGTVYRARQRTPDRMVALKVIRAGMMTSTMLARFRYEADVLARLQHPGIAQIFEAGTVRHEDVDQPYFAMELVTGLPIDLHAAEQRLGSRQRLETFAKVCDAVHHAHQRGVIHRDLKPGNVFVDASGQPKVLDFGIARAIDADLRATTLRTGAGQLVGTLPYMSPEQVSGDGRDLDARSDVFALGVLAFELLTEQLPHDVRAKTLPDALLAIRDAEPARLGSVAAHLRGDLETIVGKALEKDPSRRYASAAALADDVRRFLAYQPIVARPPSVTYQLRLFARRHRALVGGAVLAVAALVLATGISIAFAIHSQRAADREAKQRLIVERTNEQLESMLMLPDPHRQGADVTVTEMLDLMIVRLDEGRELPEVEAEVRSAIGRTYLSQRRPQLAVAQLSRAAKLWRGVDPDGQQLAEALMSLGVAQVQLGDINAGEAALREAIASLSRLDAPGVDAARGSLLDALIREKRFAEAAPLARESLDAARRSNDPVHLIAALRRVAKIDSGFGDHAAAAQCLDEAQDLARRHLSETHPVHLALLIDRSWTRSQLRDFAGAVAASTEAYALGRRLCKPGSYDWIVCTNAHLAVLEALDRRDDVIAVLTSTRESLASALGEEHRLVREVDSRLAAARAGARDGQAKAKE